MIYGTTSSLFLNWSLPIAKKKKKKKKEKIKEKKVKKKKYKKKF